MGSTFAALTSAKAPNGMESEQALVTFTGVQKTYDGHTLVVKDLNLNIRKGEFLSLLGPSGSGKTLSLIHI